MFQLEVASVQYFRFPPGLLEHTDRAYDALIYSRFPIRLNLHTVPAEYVVDLADIILQNWERVMAESLRFLSFFVSSQKQPFWVY